MPQKMVLVVRADLEMGRGKIAAQAAHAAVAAVLATRGSVDYRHWLREGQPKVVLRVDSAEQLDEITAAAQAARLPVQVIHDAGRTQLEPGTLTCGAIGPAASERIDAITGGLRLL
jgi:peptidyl-tRNA hydrolase, PTH2 family